MIGLRFPQRHHGPVACDPPQEARLVVECEGVGVVLDFGAPVEDPLQPVLGEEPERYPVLARVAETRRVPLYVLRYVLVRLQDGDPQAFDPLNGWFSPRMSRSTSSDLLVMRVFPPSSFPCPSSLSPPAHIPTHTSRPNNHFLAAKLYAP